MTVIIVNWNGAQFIERCLSALLEQTVMPNEIIVVDNASSDGSLDIVRRFPAVKLFAQGKNLGFARGNNLAVEASVTDAEWIALLNPDAFPEAQWLESLLSAVNNYPDYNAFGSKLIDARVNSMLDGAGDAYHVSGRAWRIGRGVPVSAFSEQVHEIFSPCAAAALYRRSAFHKVGGFDEDYFCYMEDVDLGFRLRLAGYRCLYVPQSVVYHIGSATTGGQQSDFAVYHGHRNLVWAYVKNMPGWLFWACLPLHIAMNLAAVCVFAMRGKGSVILRAKRDALRGLPAMWRKRREIQRRRVVPVGEIWRVLDKRVFGRH